MSAVLKDGGKPADAASLPVVERSEFQELRSEFISTTALVLSDQNLDRMMDFARIMATGKVTVPDALRNEGDCLAITMQALQWRMNPFAVAQKTHIISGKLGYEAQLVNAVINSMAPTKDRIHYEWYGPWDKILGKFVTKTSQKGNEYRAPAWTLEDEKGIGVKVWATLKGEDTPRELLLLLSQAATRNSTLWAEDPRQQLAYLAVKRWSRLYCPDVILGVYTPDEVEQIVEREIGSGTTSGNADHDKPKAYTKAEFDGFFPKWEKLIIEGKRTADEIITTITSKRPITDEQKTTIKAVKKHDATKQSGGNGAPVVTYAAVKDKLQTATTIDMLDAHADLIGEVFDPEQRAELGQFYKQRREELTPK